VRSLRTELKSCRAGFGACTATCGPGVPPDGRTSCRAEARAFRQAALNQCRAVHRATTSACIDRDLGCVETCLEDRVTCNAPARAALDAALAACAATRADGIAACQAADPAGGPAFDACVRTALAAAYACREAALEASPPAFAACTETYVQCLRDCPAPGEAAVTPGVRCRKGTGQ
jgi:hypothetical protein